MTDKTVKLIQLINEGKTCNEICAILNLSNKQLFNYLTLLRNKGLMFERKYCSNGIMYYKPISSISKLNDYNSNEDAIITRNQDNQFRCLVISDLHFGSKLERLDLLDRAYDYCIKNNIHIIFCCGDMIDGTYGKFEKDISNIYNQIEHFIKDYPFDKNILTFDVAGDHDLDGLYSGYQDIIEITNNYRQDIIIGGYNNRVVNIKNDSVHLYHHINGGSHINKNSPLSLHGHSHKYIANLADNKFLNIAVPSLSDINDSFPTALDLTLEFNKGYINYAILNQVFFSDKDYILNEQKYDLLKDRTVAPKPILHEMGYKDECLSVTAPKEKVKTLSKKEDTFLSQVEKFCRRYGDEYNN